MTDKAPTRPEGLERELWIEAATLDAIADTHSAMRELPVAAGLLCAAATALRRQEEALRTAVEALHAVRAHHAQINHQAGRAIGRSHTIRIVDEALVSIPPEFRALTPEVDS